MQDLWYLRRLDGGLFTLQTVDYILAWVAMEDDGVRVLPFFNISLNFHTTFALTSGQIRTHIQQMLSRRDKSLKDVVKTLEVYRDNVDEDDATAPDDGSPSRKEILRNLIAFLEGC